MANEIIDLTGSPPPSSRSSEAPRILNFTASASVENIQFQNAAMPSWACPNPNLHFTNQQTAPWPASGGTYELPPIVNGFHGGMHDDQIAAVFEPVPESNASLFPHRARFKEPWTPREHQLFLMGLIKYGRGRWSKIARHFLWSKTPQQVQSYAISFFKHLPSTYLYSFRRRNPTYAAANLMTRNKNLMGASACHFIPMMGNDPLGTFTLFPQEPPFFSVPPIGEASTSTTTYGFQMKTAADVSTSLTCSGEVDLELRLGRS